jgi:hypothetical protein
MERGLARMLRIFTDQPKTFFNLLGKPKSSRLLVSFVTLINLKISGLIRVYPPHPR